MNDILDPNKNTLLEAPVGASPGHFFGSMEMYVVLGTMLAVAALVFLWAAYFRKPKRSRSRRSLDVANAKDEIALDRRKRKSHRRWKNRNPTLAQIGGLPPQRPENSTPVSD